ncbi:TSEN34 [Lepeophtheirus salmonis]|uniref:tRNA-intron lyase n=1 Tax=Lepeophtheirus salmonis TaxID=72036 RepID=A0A7R8H9P6_LEPSM|nr:TSEN34 [Lepeophtheirus salmonis]CAF2958766.1 TSEN34 [Lepeophtheirus salmonis]
MIEIEWGKDGCRGFVWHLSDVQALRNDHRIVGNFVGVTKSDIEHGIPLVLMPEEIEYLVSKNIGIVVDKSRQNSDRFFSIKKSLKIKDIRKEQSLIQLRIGHVSWTEESVKEVSKEINWRNKYKEYCSTNEKHLRMAAFRDLHSKGFYLSEGFNFGADFLAYPGDPLVFHAKYLIVCREMDFQENVGMARLANSVNKILLSPSFDAEAPTRQRDPTTACRGYFRLLDFSPRSITYLVRQPGCLGLLQDTHVDAKLSADAGSTCSTAQQNSQPQTIHKF